MRPTILMALLQASICALPLSADTLPEGAKIDLQTLRRMRHEATHRPRRMIFNNDGDDVIYTKKEPTPEALLALRTSPLLGSQVDSIFYSNSLCFGDALHDSDVFTPFVSREDLFRDNAMPDYLERGIDPVQVMVDFGKANGIEIFWDMRMNDTHDAGLTGYGPLLLPQLKRDHPDWLVGAADEQPPHGSWSSVNYAVPEIRDLAYRFFEEVCTRFDVDGIELDFMRHACFFKSVAWGEVASEDELDMMTDLLRRTREMTEREGMRRGRPILIAIRVPDSVEYCRGIGLDLERWLSEGLVDILSGSCYFQLNPWEYLVELGGKYDVAVYPSLSESRVQSATRFSRNSLESYRARATRVWASGADGVYIFNYFDPRGALWRELGDPATLKGKDKLCYLSVRNGSPDTYLKGGARFRNVPVVTPVNPHLVPADGALRLELPVGDDLAADIAAGLKPTATCHIRGLGADRIALAFNGTQTAGTPFGADWMDFAVPPEIVKKGANVLELTAPAPEGPEADAGEWDVEYEAGEQLPGAPWQKMGWVVGCHEELLDGALLLADRSEEGGSYAYYQYPGFIAPAQETVVEARLKTLSGWVSVMVENGVSAEEVVFQSGSVRLRHNGLTAPATTDDDFHTYRIVFKDTDIRVYMDGELILDGTGLFTRPAYDGRSGIMFGGANSPGKGEALWQSVRLRNRAVTLLDVVLSIKYGG